MSIFPTKTDHVVVQGMADSRDRKHATRMLSADTKAVAGVNPRKASTTVAFDIAPISPGTGKVQVGTVEVPVYGTVTEAKEAAGAEVSVVFVPPAFARGAVVEVIYAEVRLLVVIIEGIPVADATWMHAYAAEYGMQIIGPNCPGIISPARSNVGITPPDITGPDPLGLASKSGTLTYQFVHELSDLGFATYIGIGGGPVVGTTHIDALVASGVDPDTRLIIMIGKIEGDAKEQAAAYIREHMTKPVVAYVAGFAAPEGRTIGHVDAIVSGSSGTAKARKITLEVAGVRVGRTPSQTVGVAHELYRQLIEEVSA